MIILKRLAEKFRKGAQPEETEFKPLSLAACILYVQSRVNNAARDASSRRNRKAQDPKAVEKVQQFAMLNMSLLQHLKELQTLKTISGHGK